MTKFEAPRGQQILEKSKREIRDRAACHAKFSATSAYKNINLEESKQPAK